MPSLPRRSLSYSILLAAALSATLIGTAYARTLAVTGSFVAEGKAATKPTGSVSGSFDTDSHALAYTITYEGLSGPVIAAHFHGPAQPGVTAGVLQPIEGPYSSPIKGQVIFGESQVRALEQGLVYVNLHTTADPAGEARAQLHVQNQP
jgi:hypothetical protein